MRAQPLAPVEAWRRHDAVEARLTAAVSARMCALAALRPGMRVLDLATGRGEPAIGAARRVGTRGRVVGFELDPAVAALAQAVAPRNLEVRVGDATVLAGVEDASFDVALCRWGLMYMASPVDALTRCREALVPDGALVAAVWTLPSPWVTLPREVLAKVAPQGTLEATPRALRYADHSLFEADCAAAGLRVVSAEEMDTPVFAAPDAAGILAWVRDLGFAQAVESLPGEVQAAWVAALTAEAERLREEDELVLRGVTRLVVAKRA